MIIVVCGLPGSGKSAVADLAARQTGATVLSTDVIRRELYPAAAGRYAVAAQEHVFEEMLRRADQLSGSGKSVVLDATFNRASGRTAAKAIAERRGVVFLLIEVTCSDDDAAQRMALRGDDNPSEADFSVRLRHRSLWEPILEEHVVIDNSSTLKDLEESVISVLKTASEK